METTLAQSMQEIADKLTDADPSVAALAHLLGNVERKYTGSGYYLTPKDPRFKSIWVGIQTGGLSGEDVTDVEVEFAAIASLQVAELDKVFGRHRMVPANPSGPLYRISYLFDKAGQPYKSTLYVTLNTPDLPGAQAEKVGIRRDKR